MSIMVRTSPTPPAQPLPIVAPDDDPGPGRPVWVVRLEVVNRPGVLAGVAQNFAALGLNIDEMTLVGHRQDPERAEIRVTFGADPRACDLVCRKLSRLLDVFDVQAEPG